MSGSKSGSELNDEKLFLEKFTAAERAFYHLDEVVHSGELKLSDFPSEPLCYAAHGLIAEGEFLETEAGLDVDEELKEVYKKEIELLKPFLEAKTQKEAREAYSDIDAILVKRARAFTISEEDPRVGLRGQRGLKVVARDGIKKGQLIAAPYPGHLVSKLRREEIESLYVLEPTFAGSARKNLSIIPRPGRGPFSLGANIHLVNSNTTYGVYDEDPVSSKKGPPAIPDNVIFASLAAEDAVLSYRVMIAKRDIAKGEELLIDYSPGYWQRIRANKKIDAEKAARAQKKRKPEAEPAAELETELEAALESREVVKEPAKKRFTRSSAASEISEPAGAGSGLRPVRELDLGPSAHEILANSLLRKADLFELFSKTVRVPERLPEKRQLAEVTVPDPREALLFSEADKASHKAKHKDHRGSKDKARRSSPRFNLGKDAL